MNDKKILLGVSGGIAAYKAIELARLLRKRKAHVSTVMTQNALEFVQALSFSAVTQGGVYSSNFTPDQDAMLHIRLAKEADAIVLAPATASLIGKLANGIFDDLLTTSVCASSAPVFLAPGMNKVMWENFAVQKNIETLRKAGFHILGPDAGEQACGDFGLGRMMEPSEIVESVFEHLEGGKKSQRFANKTILITAGPTREAIDPVRFISNHSSGKMGFALAETLQKQGAKVLLIAGPTNLSPPDVSELVRVQSAQDMWKAVQERLSTIDIFIGAAAVSDFEVRETRTHKIKKNADSFTLELHPTVDILDKVSSHTPRPFCVGFAAETDHLLENAQAKLQRKNLDMIIANSISEDFNPFYNDQNKVTVIDRDLKEFELALAKKSELATQIADLLYSRINENCLEILTSRKLCLESLKPTASVPLDPLDL